MVQGFWKWQMDKIALGSKTAKGGFLNEKFVINEFNQWQNSDLAKDCLIKMGYELGKIKSVKAQKIKGSFKADLQVQIEITIQFKTLIEAQNISIKLVSNPQGFNQIDKRWIAKYKELWNFDDEIERILKLYTGELLPYKDSRDKRRMFLDEMSKVEQESILQWLKQNQILILNDILKGRGQFAAEWFLVIQRLEDSLKYKILPINEAINLFSGEVMISKNGNIKIGKVGIQRKGGDNGRESTKMLQFKLNPCEVFHQD